MMLRVLRVLGLALPIATLCCAGPGERASSDGGESASRADQDAGEGGEDRDGGAMDAGREAGVEAGAAPLAEAGPNDAGSGAPDVPSLTCSQDFVIASAELPAKLVDCTEIVGNLSVQMRLPEARIALPNLRTLSGTLSFERDATRASFSAPRLERAGGIDFIVDSKLALELPALKEISGRLYAYGSSITELSLPALEAIKNDLDLQSNSLRSVRLPKLVRAHRVHVAVHNNLTELALPSLATASGGVQISAEEALTTLRLESLVDTGTSSVSGLEVRDCPALREIDLPLLRKQAPVRLVSNAALTSIKLPAIDSIEHMLIDRCSALTELGFVTLVTLPSLDLRTNLKLRTIAFPKLTSATRLSFSGNGALQSVSVPGLNASSVQATCDVQLGAWPCP